MYFKETNVKKIVLILLDSQHSHHTDVKKHVLSFCSLFVNSGLKPITENISKMPKRSTIFGFQKQKSVYIFPKRERN